MATWQAPNSPWQVSWQSVIRDAALATTSMPILEMLLQSLREVLSSALVSVLLYQHHQHQALPIILETVSAASGSTACCSPSPEVTSTP